MNIFKNSVENNARLTKRLFNGGWESMGHIKREPDSRTTGQLLENIEYYSQKYPEVARFKDELKSMNPKHLGLVSDVCELVSNSAFLNTSVNLKQILNNGKSFFQIMIEKMPKASKENPASLALFQAIINNADSNSAKYLLCSILPTFECKEGAKHIEATVPLVENIAESTLQGGYTMDFSKEQAFLKSLDSLISPAVRLDKLQMLPKIMKVAEKSKADCEVHAFPFLTNPIPQETIEENLKVFEKIDENLKGKTINITEFLDKNINLQ